MSPIIVVKEIQAYQDHTNYLKKVSTIVIKYITPARVSRYTSNLVSNDNDLLTPNARFAKCYMLSPFFPRPGRKVIKGYLQNGTSIMLRIRI